MNLNYKNEETELASEQHDMKSSKMNSSQNMSETNTMIKWRGSLIIH